MPEWIQQIDDQVLAWLQAHHTPWLDYNLNQVVTLGTSTVVAILSLVIAGLLLLDRQCTKVALILLLPVGAFYATDALKDAVARPRPLVGNSRKPKADTPSFPSGHSSMSMTGFLLAALALRGFWRRLGLRGACSLTVAGALAVAGMVGLSRLYFGFHFLSDVMGGWLLGILFGIIFLAVERLTDRRAHDQADGLAITSPQQPE